MEQKEYTGSCYIGVVGSELETGECRDSINNIFRRPGDSEIHSIRATKGYEARQMHLNNWIDHTQHEFGLFLDHDQTFQRTALEQLRNHKLPYVSGYYLRRQYAPIAPVFFHPFTEWPYEPYLDEPERGKLLHIGASGWGCLLIHRDVVIATREILKGENEIIEDDMDMWPFDLNAVMAGVKSLKKVVETAPVKKTMLTSLKIISRILSGELIPLRGLKNVVGSDIRFPFYALQAGFKLYLDPEVRCSHMVNYPIHPDDFTSHPPHIIAQTKQNAMTAVLKEREEIRERLEVLNG